VGGNRHPSLARFYDDKLKGKVSMDDVTAALDPGG